MKPNIIRIADVWLLGPAMVAAGYSLRRRPTLSTVMIAGGVLTMVYNARGYYLAELAKDSAPVLQVYPAPPA
jgi:hypothetical protein